MTNPLTPPIFIPTASAVESPCINICSIGRDGICAGCARTLPEIGEWASASDQRKREIMDSVERRLS